MELHSKDRLLTIHPNIRFEKDMPVSNKHKSLQLYPINYSRKMFYDTCTAALSIQSTKISPLKGAYDS